MAVKTGGRLAAASDVPARQVGAGSEAASSARSDRPPVSAGDGRPAVFLDKDGTLLVDVPYNVDPRLMRLAPGAGSGLRRLAAAGYALVVVTNQSGVARGHFPLEALAAVERRLRELLEVERVHLEGFYACPHHPQGIVPAFSGACDCRKPQPGLLLQAARSLRLDPSRSWMVGDILDDVEAGCRAGCGTVLLDNGGETIWKGGPCRTPDFRASDLDDAADAILERLETEGERCGTAYWT